VNDQTRGTIQEFGLRNQVFLRGFGTARPQRESALD